MPSVPLSPSCERCIARNDDHACSAQCPEGKRIDAIFALCKGCRHNRACTSDPRTCGYWTGVTYPIVIDDDCYSDDCEFCDREDGCTEMGVIN